MGSPRSRNAAGRKPDNHEDWRKRYKAPASGDNPEGTDKRPLLCSSFSSSRVPDPCPRCPQTPWNQSCLLYTSYSFDRDDAGADISYKKMFEAYKKIFSRMALQFRPVEADSGSIGGNFSHEFMVLAETGEDTIAYCTGCDWSANIERAAVLPPAKACEETCAAIEEEMCIRDSIRSE